LQGLKNIDGLTEQSFTLNKLNCSEAGADWQRARVGKKFVVMFIKIREMVEKIFT